MLPTRKGPSVKGESAECKECLLLQALQRLADGLVILDQRGKVRFANDAALRILRVSREALSLDPRKVLARFGAEDVWDTLNHLSDHRSLAPPCRPHNRLLFPRRLARLPLLFSSVMAL